MIVRITDTIQSIPKEIRQKISRKRLANVREVLDYFVHSESQTPAQFTFGPEEECFLDALFSNCARKRIESLTISLDKSFSHVDIVTKAKILLPIIFYNFQVGGNTVNDKFEQVKAYISSINKEPNILGERFVLKNDLHDLKRKVDELKGEYDKTLDDLEKAPDNDADGGCGWRDLRRISDEAEARYKAALAQIPKNSGDTDEVEKYREPEYYIYNDYILTPSLFYDAGAKTNSKALVFDKNFLFQFATEMMICNIPCANVEMEAQKILMKFLQVDAPPKTYFQASAFSGANEQ